MKVFQAIHQYRPYIPHFEQKYGITGDVSFNEHLRLLIKDRFYASHILKPCLDSDDSRGFYIMWDYTALQQKWASERGWHETDLKKILFAQIEEFKPDVFYNCSPIFFDNNEITQKVSRSIKKICWFAAPINRAITFDAYSTRLTNYPVDAMAPKEKTGFRSDLFHPAHDPIMDIYAKNTDRPIDLFFYGQYLPLYFKNRNRFIDELIRFKSKSDLNIELAVSYDLSLKSLYPFKRPGRVKKWFTFDLPILERPSREFQRSVTRPLYGLDLYEKIANSKLVFNAAVDFSGKYKVNMRNYETLGCAAHLISDEGIYPDGFANNEHLTMYRSFEDFIEKAEYFVKHPSVSRHIALQGNSMIKKKYSKEAQWQRFQEIVASI